MVQVVTHLSGVRSVSLLLRVVYIKTKIQDSKARIAEWVGSFPIGRRSRVRVRVKTNTGNTLVPDTGRGDERIPVIRWSRILVNLRPLETFNKIMIWSRIGV